MSQLVVISNIISGLLWLALQITNFNVLHNLLTFICKKSKKVIGNINSTNRT